MISEATAGARESGEPQPITPEIARFVHEQGTAFVASVNADATPNLSPKGSIAALDGSHLAFVDLRSPTTVRNVAERPMVEVNVVDPLRRRGYRFRGRAEVLRDGPTFDGVVAQYRARGFVSPIATVVRVRVDRVQAVTSPAYDRGETEEELVQAWAARLGVGTLHAAATPPDAAPDAAGTAANERMLNAMILRGEYAAALERFYADDVVMRQADGSRTAGLAANSAREAAMIEAGVQVSARFLGGAVSGAMSYSEWEYRLEFPSGRALEYPQVAARTWRADRVIHERFYHDPFPSWMAEEIRVTLGRRRSDPEFTGDS